MCTEWVRPADAVPVGGLFQKLGFHPDEEAVMIQRHKEHGRFFLSCVVVQGGSRASLFRGVTQESETPLPWSWVWPPFGGWSQAQVCW